PTWSTWPGTGFPTSNSSRGCAAAVDSGYDAQVTVLVGTSGWQYRHWRYRYFKRGTPQNRWFEQVMRDFRTVELNVTFYRLPKAEVFAGWYDRSPADAVITVKASRYLTHVKRLKDPQPS